MLNRFITEALYKQYKFEDDTLELHVSGYEVNLGDEASPIYDYYVKIFNVCDSYAEIELVCVARLNESTFLNFYTVKLVLFGSVVSMIMAF